jgi:hypothetical protein
MNVERWIKRNVKCCSCGEPLKNSRHINIIALDMLAEWRNPVWGNILVKDRHPEPRALAIICDNCLEKRIFPVYAVEWDMEKNIVKYHPIKDLKPLPPITEEEIAEAEQKKYMFKEGEAE